MEYPVWIVVAAILFVLASGMSFGAMLCYAFVAHPERSRVDKLVEGQIRHNQKIERVKHGMVETERRHDDGVELPPELVDLCMKFENAGPTMLREARKLVRSGAPPQKVLEKYREKIKAQGLDV